MIVLDIERIGEVWNICNGMIVQVICVVLYVVSQVNCVVGNNWSILEIVVLGIYLDIGERDGQIIN